MRSNTGALPYFSGFFVSVFRQFLVFIKKDKKKMKKK
jgi:hypothetical protein